MVKVKVQKIGKSSLAVIIPADIASLKGIEKGDTLDVQEDKQGRLVLKEV